MSSDSSYSLEGVLDALDTGLIILGGGGRVLAWNSWLESAAGISAAGAIGRQLRELFPDCSLDRLEGAIGDALAVGASAVLSHALHPNLLPLRTRSARPLVHNVAVRPLFQKERVACVVQIFDVTVASERERILRA